MYAYKYSNIIVFDHFVDVDKMVYNSDFLLLQSEWKNFEEVLNKVQGFCMNSESSCG